MLHLILAIVTVIVWAVVAGTALRALAKSIQGTRGPRVSGTYKSRVAASKSLAAERKTGLVFSQYGRIHLLWDGYWEWVSVYTNEPDWYVRPEGSTGVWVKPDQDPIEAAEDIRRGRGYLINAAYDPDIGTWYYVESPQEQEKAKKAKELVDKASDSVRARREAVGMHGPQYIDQLEKENRRLKESNLKLANALNVRSKSLVLPVPAPKSPPPDVIVANELEAMAPLLQIKECPHWNEGQLSGPCCECMGRDHIFQECDPRCIVCQHRWTPFN